MIIKRTFLSETAFNNWHEQAATAVGLAITGRNAKTGVPAPDKQQTTALTTLSPAEVDEDGNVIDPTLVATIWDDRMLANGMVDQLLRAGLLTSDELGVLVDHYPAWVNGIEYATGAIVAFNGGLYTSIIDANDWTPGEGPNAWQLVS